MTLYRRFIKLGSLERNVITLLGWDVGHGDLSRATFKSSFPVDYAVRNRVLDVRNVLEHPNGHRIHKRERIRKRFSEMLVLANCFSNLFTPYSRREIVESF